MKKDYLWSDTTIDAEAVKQIQIYLGQWKIEIYKTTLSFLTLIYVFNVWWIHFEQEERLIRGVITGVGYGCI